MATLTITTTSQQDARIVEAFGARLGLVDANGQPRNATAAEIKAYYVNDLREYVYSYETEKRAKAAIAGTDKITPT